MTRVSFGIAVGVFACGVLTGVVIEHFRQGSRIDYYELLKEGSPENRAVLIDRMFDEQANIARTIGHSIGMPEGGHVANESLVLAEFVDHGSFDFGLHFVFGIVNNKSPEIREMYVSLYEKHSQSIRSANVMLVRLIRQMDDEFLERMFKTICMNLCIDVESEREFLTENGQQAWYERLKPHVGITD